MAWLWSNPTPGGHTLPDLQSQFKVESPNIGGLISAILESRARADKQSRSDMNSLISGVGSVAGGVASGYQHQGTEDTARAAQYFSQNPQAYDDYLQSGQLPAGVTRGSNLDDVMLQKMMQGQGAPQFYTDPNTGSSVYRWPGGGGGSTGGRGGGQLRAPGATGQKVQLDDGTFITGNAYEANQRDATKGEAQNARYKDYTAPNVTQFYSTSALTDPSTISPSDDMDEQGRVTNAYAVKNPDKVTAVLPDGTTMLYKDFVKVAGKVAAKGEVPVNRYKAAAGINAGGETGDGSYGSGAGNPNGLRAEAQAAIRAGKDPELVRAKFKDMTGEDL